LPGWRIALYRKVFFRQSTFFIFFSYLRST